MKANNQNIHINSLVMIATIIIMSVIILSSCTKVIDVKVGNDTGKLVIEGIVVDTLGVQSIKLTTNVPFSDSNTYPPVTGAMVTVDDGKGSTHNYVENKAGIYTSPPYTTTPGNKYTMRVDVNGTIYTAGSIMPELVRLDSLSSKVSSFDSKQREVTAYYKDPAGKPNYYRFILFINGVQVKTTFAYNDDFNDGKNVVIDLSDDDTDMFSGDKVTVEMHCIDKPMFTYWSTLMQQGGGGPGGGVTPSNPPTNITPTVLGYFSAYTAQKRSIVVK